MMQRAKSMLNRNDEGYAPVEIDMNIRPFMQYIKYYESGFRLLTEKFEKNPDQEALKGKFSDLLSEIWSKISEEESDPFVEICHLTDIVSKRLNDNIVKKKDI